MKLIYHNFIIFVVLYFLISFIYRFVLLDTDWQREVFELLCIYAARFQSYIPLNFLIGFYVQQVGKFGCLGSFTFVKLNISGGVKMVEHIHSPSFP